MRITFLTGSLQPGQDGVGDYTLMLADECLRRGTKAQLIALADRHIETPLEDRCHDVTCVRLPKAQAWRDRLAFLERRLRGFNPDWVSVQFVPYSFQRWGVVHRLTHTLPRIVAPARLHLMLHEIWTGGDGSWRAALTCNAQRWSVLRLCRSASLVHTSNSAYRGMVEAHGVPTSILPLFGSVPISDEPRDSWIESSLARRGIGIQGERDCWWLAVFFGTIQREWSPEPMLSQLRMAATAAGKKMALISVGRIGDAGECTWHRMEADYGGAVPMIRVGEQPPTRISQLLQVADFGIATTPYWLLGKSSTAAAMFEHGLPIIVSREDGPTLLNEPIGDEDLEQLIRLDDRFSIRVTTARRRPPRRRLSAVASRLMHDLETASTRKVR